jgi:hypothetical protein
MGVNDAISSLAKSPFQAAIILGGTRWRPAWIA